MLSTARNEYHKYFTPFPFDEQSLLNILKSAEDDIYFGIWFENVLIGFFMLRGFDAGYSIPAFGVSIREQYSQKGLLSLTLQFAITFCKLNSIPQMMLKVHPENIFAKETYEKFGFKQFSVDEKNGNILYKLNIK
jgi:RimJ/RimL family protein N-acetyltransferase